MCKSAVTRTTIKVTCGSCTRYRQWAMGLSLYSASYHGISIYILIDAHFCRAYLVSYKAEVTNCLSNDRDTLVYRLQTVMNIYTDISNQGCASVTNSYIKRGFIFRTSRLYVSPAFIRYIGLFSSARVHLACVAYRVLLRPCLPAILITFLKAFW